MMRTFRWIFRLFLLVAVVAVLLLTVSHRWREVPSSPRRLTVMTWNVFRFDENTPLSRNRVIRYLQDHPVDIICLEEAEALRHAPYLTLPEIKSALGEIYPYSYLDFKIYNGYRQYGLMVFSRYPLLHKQTVRYPSEANMSGRCDVVVGADTFRLFVNHLESNKLLIGKDPRDTLISKVKHAAPIRRMEARVVSNEVSQSPYPVLVMGDFNSLPLSYTYLRMRLAGWRWLRDAHLEGSRGRLGSTFFIHGLGGRIDYILVDPFFTVERSWVDRTATGSDHFPVFATIGY